VDAGAPSGLVVEPALIDEAEERSVTFRDLRP